MPDSQRPNILIIYADQLRHDCIGALGSAIQTPNIDRLVRGGTACTQAFTASPVCMAARWSLHTGQWTSTHQCYSNHHPGPRPDYSLPGLLRDAGYRTGLVGKNHSFLTEADLDYFNQDPDALDKDAAHARWQWIQEHKANEPRLSSSPVGGGLAGDPDHAKTDAALDFMQANSDGPFFLWLSYHHPHTPYYAPEPFCSMYADCDPLGQPQCEDTLATKPFRQQFHQQNNDALLPFSQAEILQMRRVYAGMVSLLDYEIGRVLDLLDARGISDDTLILFMSDHGDYMGDHHLVTKSPSLYDCLVRTPFIVRWPGQVPAGCISEALISQVDVMPTVLTAAGIATPAAVEGLNLLPCLSTADNELRPFVVSEYGIPGTAYTPAQVEAEGIAPGQFHNPSDQRIPWEGNPVSLAGRIRMLRTRDWKLVEDSDGNHELYDLRSDPAELHNLYGKHAYAAVQENLMQQLQQWKDEHHCVDTSIHECSGSHSSTR